MACRGCSVQWNHRNKDSGEVAMLLSCSSDAISGLVGSAS